MHDPEGFSVHDKSTAAAPEYAAQAEPQAAPSEEATPATAENDAAVGETGANHSSGAGDKPRAKAKAQKRSGSNGSHDTASDTGPSDQPPSLRQQLLAPLTIPPVTLDRRLLPANLLDALDAAGLGARETLPAAALMALAAVAAVAGPGVRCGTVGDRGLIGTTNDTALRVALIAADRRAPLVPSAILAGAYAAENDLFDLYAQAEELNAADRRAAAERRRLHARASAIAVTLGAPPPPPLAEAAPVPCGARPRIVVRDGAAAAIRAAAAGGSGLLVIDERRMVSMAGIAGFYDGPTEVLLSSLARGDRVPIVDPKTGRTEMRALPASLIGVVTTTADCPLLNEVAAASFIGTALLPAVPAPTGDDGPMVTLLRRVGAIAADAAVTLQLPVGALASAAEAWAALAAGTQPPLSDYLAHLPDLARRLAAVLHLAAAGGDGKIGPAIQPATVKKAISIINVCVLPTAQAVLSPVSTAEAIRDARRIVDHLRATTSAQHARFERRPLLRSWQASMPSRRLDAAIQLLEAETLLTAVEKAGGQQYDVAFAIYGA
jgi:hypothetical protein